jgi:FtsZ-interacting cell division protein ZipA
MPLTARLSEYRIVSSKREMIMPLIILGLLVVIGIVIYALARNRQNEEVDTRTVRERYPHVFEKFDEIKDEMKKGANYTVIEDEEEPAEDVNAKYRDEDGHTLHFPDDAEVEKRKRNIH